MESFAIRTRSSHRHAIRGRFTLDTLGDTTHNIRTVQMAQHCRPSRIDSPVFVQNSTAGVDMIKITTSKARQEFARVLRKIKNGKRFLLERHNKGVAAIVSVEDLALLEAIENRHDLEEERLALWRKSPRRAPFPGSKSRPNSALKMCTQTTRRRFLIIRFSSRSRNRCRFSFQPKWSRNRCRFSFQPKCVASLIELQQRM